MILEWLIGAIFGIIKGLFNLLPSVPSMPYVVSSSIIALFDLIFDNIQLLGFFLPIPTIKVLVPALIIVINFEHIYHFVIWIIKKIPISSE